MIEVVVAVYNTAPAADEAILEVRKSEHDVGGQSGGGYGG